MKAGEETTRWTILNMPESIRKKIKQYAKENGYKLPRAIEELTEKELREWEKKKKQER